MPLPRFGNDGEIVGMERVPPSEIPDWPEGGEEQFSVELVTYMSQGLRVKGYLIKPAAAAKARLPGMVYCRGGIGRVGMVRAARMMRLAAYGYIVFAPVYRGNLGGEGREDFGGEDRHDLFAGIKVLLSVPEAAPGKVPLLGFSRGAIMALRAARECPEVGPVAVWGGVSDLFDTYEERVDLRRMLRRVVGHPRKHPLAYEERSPRRWADRIDNPVLIVHGTEDVQVGVRHAHGLAEALEAAGKTYAMRLYDGVGHLFPPDADRDALSAIFAWFEKHRQVKEEEAP